MIAAKVIALSLIPAGAAAFGVVGYLQHQPRAFTTQTEVAPSLNLPPPPVAVQPVVEAPPAPEPELVVKPLVVKPPPAAKPPLQPKQKEAVGVPCSGWRDLGYQHVENGNATGVSRVRELCDPNLPAKD